MENLNEVTKSCSDLYFGLITYKKNSDLNRARTSFAFIGHGEGGDLESQLEKLKASIDCVEMQSRGFIRVFQKEFIKFAKMFEENDIGFCIAVKGSSDDKNETDNS